MQIYTFIYHRLENLSTFCEGTQGPITKETSEKRRANAKGVAWENIYAFKKDSL